MNVIKLLVLLISFSLLMPYASAGEIANTAATASGAAPAAGAPATPVSTSTPAGGAAPVPKLLPASTAATSSGVKVAARPTPREIVFPNGLKLILLEDHSFPVVSCLAWYRVGSRNERTGSTGVTHLLEHMLFGNVGTFRKGEIGSTIARVGGQFNGFTSDDFTTFFETLPSNKLELALRIESERMRGAQFTDADVQEELSNIQREFENDAKDPNALLSQEVRSMLYLHHPYHNPTMGWRSDVEGLTAAQVKDYYNKYFHPNNCTLVIAGDLNSKSATDLVQKYFGGLPKSPNPVPQVAVKQEPQRSERRSVIKFSGKQEVLQMAFHAPALQDPDAPAMVVLEKMLNSSSGGKFRSKLVEPKVCSTASCAFEIKKDPGFMTITCAAIPATSNAQQKIIDAVDSLLGQLRTQPPSEAELRRAKNQAEFSFFCERESAYRAGFHLGYFENLSSWKDADSWGQRLREVNAADVQRVAKRYLTPETRVVVWLAGTNAPKAPAPKVEPPAATPSKPTNSKPEHTRLTGYKDDDNAIAPKGAVIASATGVSAADKPAAAAEPNNIAREAVKKLPNALPSAVHNLPNAVGRAPEVVKELPQAVEAVPTVIKNLPSAVGQIPSVIRQIPSTIGSVPGAIKEIPGALGNMPGAAANVVKELPGAVGNLPGAAASVIKELPSAIGGIPGATAGAIRSVPAAIGNFATDLGGIPGAIGRQLSGPDHRVSTMLGTTRRTLKNGMTLVIHESHLSPVVHIAGASRAGSAHESSGAKKGSAALVTSVFNLGTQRRGRMQVVTQQEDLGIQPHHMLHFDHDSEVIQFASRCLTRDLPAQLELISETLTAPALGDAELEKAKQETISEAQRSEDNSTKAERAMYRSLLAHGSPFCPEDPSELVKCVNTLTSAETRKYINSFVVPTATTLVIVGDVDTEATVQMVEKAFATWNGKGNHQKIAAHINSRQVLRTAVPTKDKARATVGFGKLLPVPFGGPEYGNMLIADTIFSKHPLISRLGQKLGQDESLARAIGSDSIDTNLTQVADSLAWSFTADVEPNSVPLTVTALQNELKLLSKSGVSQEEFVEARRYLSGAIPVRSMSNLSATARTLLNGALRSADADPQSILLTNVKTADLESVNRLIKHTLKPETSTLIVVGNSQSIRSTRNHVATTQTTDQGKSDAVSGAADNPSASGSSSD
jgi:zinc protease